MKLSRTHGVFGVIVLLLLSACSSPQRDPATGELQPRRDSSRLTPAELQETRANDAYEAIRVLRPAWLRQRGQASITQQSTVVVYMDDFQLGGPESLRSIPITSITGIQFLDASTATQRWGTNHVHGAILISTMRR